MLKIMTIVGTRPEIIKLSRVISELDKYSNHILVHTGQNYDYELNQIFFNDLGIKKPDYFLEAAGSSAAETIANVIAKSDVIFEKENPDALLIYGDTNSSLSVISAKRRKIPIFHMEAGNRCFDLRVPEEINRKIVDHLSDINMVISEHARRNLIAEGIRPDTIIKTGSSMYEVLNYYKDKIQSSDVLDRESLQKDKYFLISAHREENIDYTENFQIIIELLDRLAKLFGLRILFSTHPRTRKKMESFGYENRNRLVEFMKPYGFFDYINLQKNAFCVISDSGTITEEASLLQFPAITIRQAHERPEGMDEGTVIMTGLNIDNIITSIKITRSQFEDTPKPFNVVPDYIVDNLSKKVTKIIYSYKSYVNRVHWRINDK